MTLTAIPRLVPIAVTVTLLGAALLFTRAWLNDTDEQAAEQLRILGMRPGRKYKLGGSWTRAAVRDPRNALWGSLALGSWVMLAAALVLVRR